MQQFAVETWSPDYGASFDPPSDVQDPNNKVDAFVEKAIGDWRPIRPDVSPAGTVLFIDGVQRIDARIWVSREGISQMGLCVSMAAGIVRCSSTAATIENVLVQRVALGPASLGTIECEGGITYTGVPVVDLSPEGLESALRRRREDLEVRVAHSASACDLMIVDGHVRQRETIPGAVGYLKSHQVQYLDPPQGRVVGQLAAGERTPIFLMETPWSRYSWYLRLPGVQSHDWAGIVRCEASSSSFTEARQLADCSAVTLPRFASQSYKDPRAPQNLYPVGGLERDMRRQLGDPVWLLRALMRASHRSRL